MSTDQPKAGDQRPLSPAQLRNARELPWYREWLLAHDRTEDELAATRPRLWRRGGCDLTTRTQAGTVAASRLGACEQLAAVRADADAHSTRRRAARRRDSRPSSCGRARCRCVRVGH